MTRTSLVVVSAAFLFPAALATCDCGYKTNTQQLFQFSLLTNFSTLSISQFQNSPDWDISSIFYAAGSTHPYSINYTTANVDIVNKALQLTCSASYDVSTVIASAQIQTKRDDILYGSFRAKFSVNGGRGAVGALFFYASDEHEIDIELLTRDNPRNIHFTNQPSSTSDMYMPDRLGQSMENTYRFDWNAAETTFFVDDILSDTKTSDVPSVNGSVYMNMWANGGAFSGKATPSSNVIMSISQIELYFNTSDASLSKSWAKTCAKSKAKVCDVRNGRFKKNCVR